MILDFVEVKPRIFALRFDKQYDCAMHFLRVQEFYESPNPAFYEKPFEILTFMEWYAEEYGNGCFSYTDDYLGFNVTGKAIHKLFKNKHEIADWNNYDSVMFEIYQTMFNKYQTKCCLIGYVDGDKQTYKHEMAHAMWSLNKNYKIDMEKLIEQIPKNIYKILRQALLDTMYNEKVVDDEIQAYLSTGLVLDIKKSLKVEGILNINEYSKMFKKVFKKYFSDK